MPIASGRVAHRVDKHADQSGPAPARRQTVLSLLVLAAAVTSVNVTWSLRDTRPPYWDMASHLQKSLEYAWYLETRDLSSLFFAYSYYPPLVYWVTAPFHVVLGPSVPVAVASLNLVFTTVLLLATYGLAARLWSPRVGLLSAVAIVATPYVASTSKEYALDVPLTAMAALTLYLLVRTEDFERRRYSLLLGAAVGAGMLTKWTYVFVLAVPLAFVAARAALTAVRRRDLAPAGNAALAGAVAFLLSGPWYLQHLGVLRRDFATNNAGSATREGDPAIGSVEANLYYLDSLLNEQLYLVPVVLLLIGLVVLLTSRRARSRNALLVLYVVGVYVSFALLANKNARFTMPILVGVVPLAVYWIDLVRSRLARTALCVAVTLYSGLVFLAVSFGSPLSDEDPQLAVGPVTAFSEQGHLWGPPSADQWHLEDMLRAVTRDSGTPKTLTYAGPDTIWFNSDALRFHSTLQGVRFSNDVEFLAGQQAVAIGHDAARFVAVREAPGQPGLQASDIVLLQRYALPDGTRLSLYRRSEPPNGADTGG